jgi:putative peptidoglycan lipid II flippase
MNLPLGTFGVAISSILLTHFSRMVLYAPKRLNFYILEVTKVITWVIIPTTIFIMFVSRQIFATLFFSKSTCSPEQMSISGLVLSIYVSGLIFFCLNKVLLNVFYSLKDTKTTTKIILTAAIVNILGDLIGMLTIGIYGIAASLVISGVTLTFSCFYFLHTKYKFDFYLGNYLNFLWRYSIQIIIAVLIFLISYFTIFMFLEKTSWYNFFANNIGYWFIVCPLATIIMLAIFLTRKLCGIELYFLS